MSIDLLSRFGVGYIWRKRVAPAHFELRRILIIENHRVVTSSHINGDKSFYDYEFCDLYAPLGMEPSQISLAGSGHRPEHIVSGNMMIEEVRAKIYAFYVDLLSRGRSHAGRRAPTPEPYARLGAPRRRRIQ